jgi:hypothetical protein
MNGLVNYWPFDLSLNDSIGEANLYNCDNNNYINDKYGNIGSALRLRRGYCHIPPGVYFNNSDYSLTVWIRPRNYGDWPKIIDIGNGKSNDNVFFTYSQEGHYVCFANIQKTNWDQSVFSKIPIASQKLKLNQWSHLAFVYRKSNNSNIYINGTLVYDQFYPFSPLNVYRKKNYLGKSNWNSDAYADADFDELKIYNRALNFSEVLFDMNIV